MSPSNCNSKDKFTQEQIQQIQEAFSLFDRDCDGKIPIADLGTVMRSVGASPTEAELQQLGKELSGQGVSLVDFDGFLPLAARFFRSETEKELKEAFRVFDKDGKGYVDAKELRHVLTTLGERLTDKEAEQFIREADPSGSGKIKYEDFLKVLLIN